MRTKTFTVTSPLTVDIEALRYFTAESFYRRVADLGMEIIEYTEADVPAKDVSRQAREQFPDVGWIRFTAVCKYSAEIESMLNERYGDFE